MIKLLKEFRDWFRLGLWWNAKKIESTSNPHCYIAYVASCLMEKSITHFIYHFSQSPVDRLIKVYMSFHIPITLTFLTLQPFSMGFLCGYFVFNPPLTWIPEKLSQFVHSVLRWLNMGNCHTIKFALPFLLFI